MGGSAGRAQVSPAAESASAERRAALLSVARLFQAPETIGLTGVNGLLPLTGFDLQKAEFHVTALQRPRDNRQGTQPGRTSPSSSPSLSPFAREASRPTNYPSKQFRQPTGSMW